MGIQEEISVFLSACLTGVVVATVYGALRIFRRLIGHSLFWISVEDFVYWVWCAVYIFLEILRTCSGRIRWYYAVGLVMSGCVFGSFVCKFIKKRIDKSKKTR